MRKPFHLMEGQQIQKIGRLHSSGMHTLVSTSRRHSGALSHPVAAHQFLKYPHMMRGDLLRLKKSSNGSDWLGAGGSVRPQYLDTNFPKDEDGRTYHVGTKNGEVARRILMVGSHSRAVSIAGLLQPLNGCPEVFHHESKRNFITFTGLFNEKRVSIVTSMMGFANMDFAVRESVAVAQCPVAILRLGTCGILQAPGEAGDLLVASKGSVAVRRNPDAYSSHHLAPYNIHKRILPNPELSKLVIKHAREELGDDCVKEVLNVSADSFYDSQGRSSAIFDDRNDGVIDDVIGSAPEVVSMEMETFHLFDLARRSRGKIAASAACLGLMERHTDRVIDMSLVDDKEMRAGISSLRALTQFLL